MGPRVRLSCVCRWITPPDHTPHAHRLHHPLDRFHPARARLATRRPMPAPRRLRPRRTLRRASPAAEGGFLSSWWTPWCFPTTPTTLRFRVRLSKEMAFGLEIGLMLPVLGLLRPPPPFTPQIALVVTCCRFSHALCGRRTGRAQRSRRACLCLLLLWHHRQAQGRFFYFYFYFIFLPALPLRCCVVKRDWWHQRT